MLSAHCIGHAECPDCGELFMSVVRQRTVSIGAMVPAFSPSVRTSIPDVDADPDQITMKMLAISAIMIYRFG